MTRFLLILTLLALTACGGGGRSSQPPSAPALTYTDPAGPGWRWVQNPVLSSPTRLVLELQGPGTSVSGRGVAFSLQADPAALAWAAPNPASGSLVENLAFNLGTGIPLLKYGQDGGLLRAGIFQKGQGNATALNGSLCRVALVPAGPPQGGRPLALTVQANQLFPETGSTLADQACAIGTVTFQ